MTDDLNAFTRDFGTVNARLHRGLRTVVRVTALEAEGVMKAEEPVDTGTMRNSTRARFAETGESADVGPTVNYAGFVAYGTRRQAPNPFDLRTAEIMGPKFEARCTATVEGLL